MEVLAIATPLVAKYGIGGPVAIVADAEGIARELVQSLFNDANQAVKAAPEPAPAPVTPASPASA